EGERTVRAEVPHLASFRVYDEPDVNLDYAAERQLFGNIIDAVLAAGSRTQAVVCTHSLTLVDRAPAGSINLIQASDEGTRRIQCLVGDDDDEVREFLSEVGRSVGIANSSFFYERAFLVVEGESEENAIPILYKNLFGRSLVQDGIAIVPMFTCSAWRATLHLLRRHKAEVTVMLLDQD